jgi:hypothetical protein
VHLEEGRVKDAVQLAGQYQNLVFFAHALEILLHTVVEAEPDRRPSEMKSEVAESADPDALLRTVITFLDHFDDALDVVVRCARKTEMTRWPRLFAFAGNPSDLFEVSRHMTCERTVVTLMAHSGLSADKSPQDSCAISSCFAYAPAHQRG